MVDRVIYEKSEPDFMPFCVVNFRKLDQVLVAASHDQPWWPPHTINEVSKNGGRLSRSTMVAASHNQLTVAASHDQLSR